MADFKELKILVQKQFRKISQNQLYIVDVDKDKLWDLYLDSFPEGTNNIFRERREYDCQCCKQFIRKIGNIVCINNDYSIETIWDFEAPDQFSPVIKSLNNLIKNSAIKNVFLTDSKHAGVDSNKQLIEDLVNGNGVKHVKTWEHFFTTVPDKFVCSASIIPESWGMYQANKDVYARSILEITFESAQIVKELIDQNSLYRGKEFESLVDLFILHKSKYNQLNLTEDAYHNFCWLESVKLGNASKFKNTVIGTLLSDISDGMELDDAVKRFEQKVAPTNYKRTTALITQSMIQKAQEKFTELGFESALYRRFAEQDDVTINNVIYADKSVRKRMGAFDSLEDQSILDPRKFSNIAEINIDEFLRTIVPNSNCIEILVENRLENNLISLVAPVYPDSKNMFKWNNNFTWSYNGEVTDSIKERVKKAGGSITGHLRCSLSWSNFDDLDIHVVEPDGNRIFFRNKFNAETSGHLDVDENAGHGRTRTPVENIIWKNRDTMFEGKYVVFIHNFQKRENQDEGFDVEIECLNQIFNFHYPKSVRDDEKVLVVKFNFSKTDGIKLIESIPERDLFKEIWGIKTHNFARVNMIMKSPNHWDDNHIGNEHLFFIIDNCLNPNQARGFYNEFLNSELMPHRKVLEVLSSKMKTEKSDNQLSGLGFSSTQPNSVYFRVTAHTKRTIKVNF